MAVNAAKVVEQRSHIVPGKLKITEYFFDVPTDYLNASSRSLRLFARSAARHNVTVAHESSNPTPNPPAYLLYLQGGPGGECKSPQSYAMTQTLVDKGYTVLYMDQRGTGLSSPVSASTLGLRGDDAVQASYLRHFRADNIVRDAEAIRKALTADCKDEQAKKWSIIGQSFGGFCATTYLSFFPEGLREAFITGGLPPVTQRNPDEVYKRLLPAVARRNRQYYEKYPEDISRVKTIMSLLRRFGPNTVRLPSEGALTAQRFLAIGLAGLGMTGGFDSLHDVVLRCSAELEQFGHLTRQTAFIVENALNYDNAVLYCILHEAIYCQGPGQRSAWSADRIIKSMAEFDIDGPLAKGDDTPLYFTAEQVFPWMLDAYTELRKLAGPANLLADVDDWPELYDLEQLRRNNVPVYAMVYADDLYVDLAFSMETASIIKGCKTQVTSNMYHDSLRQHEQKVMQNLFALRDDTVD